MNPICYRTVFYFSALSALLWFYYSFFLTLGQKVDGNEESDRTLINNNLQSRKNSYLNLMYTFPLLDQSYALMGIKVIQTKFSCSSQEKERIS